MLSESDLDVIDLLRRSREDMRSGRYRRIRMASGLSRREVADQLGVGFSAVAHWETALRCPQNETALRYARLMEELARRLFEEEKQHHPDSAS
jgi:transcriptional regulator with XRE-family HTH domain